MSETDRPTNVLIAGGGVAALELLLALRVLAGSHVAITVLTSEPTLAPPAMTVAEPFDRGGAQAYDWAQIAEQQGAHLVLDVLVAVDTAARTVFTHGGRRLRYDVLAVVTGARRVEPFAGALTFGTRTDATGRLRALVADVLTRDAASVAFAVPSPSCWPLPLYELALLTTHELREHGSATAVRIVTPEQRPLGLFGAAPGDALAPMLDALDIELVTHAQPREFVAGELRLDGGEVLPADHVVTVADIVARPIPGLPCDRAGFVPVDLHGRVAREPAVYAAGEATSFPLRQGGLATQQADAVAEAIAATLGLRDDPAPFSPVLRGRLLTSGAPLYLQARPAGQSLASTRALWSPPEKIAGRYLAPYLATARPARMGAAPLVERVPMLARASRDKHGAVTLALSLADAEARCGNEARALQALEAARALDPDGPATARERAAAELTMP
jgi:sulfide:quinone oxidoreductase